MAYSGRGPTYKVVLLGELGVGKTSLFKRLKDNTFDEYQTATTGIDSCTKVMKVDNEQVMLSIWDTAGVERFRTLTRNYYRNAHATVFVYTLTEASSLHYLAQWIRDAQNFCPDAIRMLVGNKNDLENEIDQSTAQAFANLHGFDNVRFISCKTNDGIQEAFQQLANELHKPKQKHSSSPTPDTVNPGRDVQDKPDFHNAGKGCNC